PRPSGEIGLALGDRRPGAFSLWFSLSAVVAESRVAHDLGNLTLWLVGGRLLGCPLRIGASAFFVRPCAGLSAGAGFAGLSGKVERSATSVWISPEAIGHVEWYATSAFFLQLEGGLLFRSVGGNYAFSGASPSKTVVYSQPPISGRGALGVGVKL